MDWLVPIWKAVIS
ncbi:unnamed protein product [Linum tenue]|uniref:Uncharacterized protein n=1 Tax=Linum tenue TaxID=586396 RepID=A0AAV0QSH9_9ROSI|nr:unnamed protein product [Linum tenue]